MPNLITRGKGLFGKLDVKTDGGFSIGGTAVTSTAAELNKVDGAGLLPSVVYGTINYQGTAAAGTTLFTLPSGAIPLRFDVFVRTAFNGSGTDLLSVGTASALTYFLDTVDLSTAGQVTVTTKAAGLAAALPASTAVKALYADQNSNASTGTAVVTCWYRTA